MGAEYKLVFVLVQSFILLYIRENERLNGNSHCTLNLPAVAQRFLLEK